MSKFKTEDIVRDEAGQILEFSNTNEYISGVGQTTTFNQLGFKGILDKPDGWYLPKDLTEPAIVLETKNSKGNIEDNIPQLQRYIEIVQVKYKKVIGIIYNGYDVIVFKDGVQIDIKDKLFSKSYYLNLYNKNLIDKESIYNLTKRINDNLHNKFGINNLNHRMIFTACALVAKRYGAMIIKDMSWVLLHNSILNTLQKSYEEAKQQNSKLDLIGECFSLIRCNYTQNQEAINDFIECVEKISDNINSDYWRGEDVMGIFFNEFTRYKGKSEQGQVFTPDHITSFMYRITETSHKDNILDACCGSGAFLVKAMSNMIQEVGGINAENECKKIKTEKLFGVEFDKELFALACANMLIHKDGKTNLIQDDSRTDNVCKWIKSKGITKVLMNPPYERKYGCLDIVENVLNNVEDGAICAFILPDTKLEINRNKVIKWLKKHTLQKIIKLPDIFSGMASNRTSIFIFKTGEPQITTEGKNNKCLKEIFTCWIQDDGLKTVKNQGRHDIDNKWQAIEDYWVDVIYKQSGDNTSQWINPLEHLNYQLSKPDFIISNKDINKVCLNYILFKRNIDISDFEESVKNYYLYGEENVLLSKDILTYLNTQKKCNEIDTSDWKKFKLLEPFFIVNTGAYIDKKQLEDGNIPRITVTGKNNGIYGKYKYIDNSNYRTYENFVSYSFLGTSFYHPYTASLDMKVHCISPLNYELNEYSGLFLTLILSKTFSGDYDDQMSSSDLKKSEIYLPTKKCNKGNFFEPDWEAIENYIKPIYDEIEKLIIL